MAEKSVGKILIIDDDLEYVTSTTKLLNAEGYSTVAAYSCSEAFERLRFENVKLILLDEVLPDIPGHEFVKELSKEPRYSKIPVIVITSTNDMEVIIQYKNSGRVLGYMLKPYKKEILLPKIEKLFPKQAGTQIQKGEGETILIIDDDANFYLPMKLMLEKLNYNPVVCDNSLSSVSKALACNPDLIMLDLKLEGGPDGISVLSSIKREELLAEIPVFMVSGYFTHTSIKSAQRLKVDGLYNKPLNYNEFFKEIHKKLTQKRKAEAQKNALPPMERLIKRILETVNGHIKMGQVQLSEFDKRLLDFSFDKGLFVNLKTVRLTDNEMRQELTTFSELVVSFSEWILRILNRIICGDIVSTNDFIDKNFQKTSDEIDKINELRKIRQALADKLSTAIALHAVRGEGQAAELSSFFTHGKDKKIETLINEVFGYLLKLETLRGGQKKAALKIFKEKSKTVEKLITSRNTFFESFKLKIGAPETKEQLIEIIELEESINAKIVKSFEKEHSLEYFESFEKIEIEEDHIEKCQGLLQQIITEVFRRVKDYIDPSHDFRCRKKMTKSYMNKFLDKIYEADSKLSGISLFSHLGFPTILIFPGAGSPCYIRDLHIVVFPLFVENPVKDILDTFANLRINSDRNYDDSSLISNYGKHLKVKESAQEQFKEDYYKWVTMVGRGESKGIDEDVIWFFMNNLGPEPYEPIPPTEKVFREATTSNEIAFSDIKYLEAWTRWNEGNYEETKKVVGELLSQKPNDARFLYMVALLALHDDRKEVACEYFNKVANMDTNNLWKVYAMLLAKKNEPKEVAE